MRKYTWAEDFKSKQQIERSPWLSAGQTNATFDETFYGCIKCSARLPPMLHDVAWPCNMLQHQCNKMKMFILLHRCCNEKSSLLCCCIRLPYPRNGSRKRPPPENSPPPGKLPLEISTLGKVPPGVRARVTRVKVTRVRVTRARVRVTRVTTTN